MRIKIFAIVALFIGIVMLSLTSCTSDDEPVSTQSNSDTQRAKISFQVSTSSYDATRADTDEGDPIESFISPYNFRVYFYDITNDVYIAELENAILTYEDGSKVEWQGYEIKSKYIITGDVPDELKSYTSFKVVVIANWMRSTLSNEYELTYPDIAVGSTIKDLCINSANTELYDFGGGAEGHSQGAQDGEMQGCIFPFYGVHQYKNISFNTNGTTTLDGIDLLRAFAKVQITFTGPSYTYKTFPCMILGNDKPSCAPLGVYSEDDYSKREINCVESLTMYSYWNATSNNLPYAYLAEYDNHKSETPAMIMYFPDIYAYDYVPIYFAEYDEDGKTTAYDDDTDANKAKRWDIVRNTLYKFEVTYVDDVSGARAIDPSIKKSSNTPNIKVKSERIELK